MTKAKSIQLAATGAQPTSPEHKRFAALLQKIEEARGRLQQWQQALPFFAQTHSEKLGPLRAQLVAGRRLFVFALEQRLLGHKWSKADAATLADWLCEQVGALLDLAEQEDPELEALYDRHAERSRADQAREHAQTLKQAMQEVSGLDLGDEPVGSVEELMARAQARMREAKEAAEAGATERPRQRRKSAKQKKEEAEQANASQTVREVYRKLASALHPDRAQHLPAAQREQRTEQMQRANGAYARGDLLALLELQLQIDQVDLAQAAQMAADKVRHFNKVLAEQLKELQAEIDDRQATFCDRYRIPSGRRIDPTQLGTLLKEEQRALEMARLRLAADQRMLQGDEAGIRRFLKEWRAEQRELDMLDNLFR